MSVYTSYAVKYIRLILLWSQHRFSQGIVFVSMANIDVVSESRVITEIYAHD